MLFWVQNSRSDFFLGMGAKLDMNRESYCMFMEAGFSSHYRFYSGQNLYYSMRENHHLKHHGRQQYWNFLKGIGMPMEETIQHVREEFVKVLTVKVTLDVSFCHCHWMFNFCFNDGSC